MNAIKDFTPDSYEAHCLELNLAAGLSARGFKIVVTESSLRAFDRATRCWSGSLKHRLKTFVELNLKLRTVKDGSAEVAVESLFASMNAELYRINGLDSPLWQPLCLVEIPISKLKARRVAALMGYRFFSNRRLVEAFDLLFRCYLDIPVEPPEKFDPSRRLDVFLKMLGLREFEEVEGMPSTFYPINFHEAAATLGIYVNSPSL